MIKMCGIFACLGCPGLCSKNKEELLVNLTHRGPDFTGDLTIPISDGRELYLLGTLLQMRGRITPQPLTQAEPQRSPLVPEPQEAPLDERHGNSLLWNGNVFGGGVKVGVGENDTVAVFQVLNQDASVLSSLSKIHGPWAFVYWQDSTRSLWFGRDVFGRRSLVWHLPVSADDALSISSVGSCDHRDGKLTGYWKEVPASCVYQLLCSGSSQSPTQLICYPWMHSATCFQNEQSVSEELQLHKTCLGVTVVKDIQLQVPIPPLNKTLPTPGVTPVDADSISPLNKTLPTRGVTPVDADSISPLNKTLPTPGVTPVDADSISPLNKTLPTPGVTAQLPPLNKPLLTAEVTSTNTPCLAQSISRNHSSHTVQSSSPPLPAELADQPNNPLFPKNVPEKPPACADAMLHVSSLPLYESPSAECRGVETSHPPEKTTMEQSHPCSSQPGTEQSSVSVSQPDTEQYSVSVSQPGTEQSSVSVSQPGTEQSSVSVSQPGTEQSSASVSHVDWDSTAEEFLTAMQEAVAVRVRSAPDLPSCWVHSSRPANTARLSPATCGGGPSDASYGAYAGTVAACCGTLHSSSDGSSDVLHGKAKIGVLYSGGVDSVVLAALVDRCLPPDEEIDLINVAFQQTNSETKESNFAVPDRISAIQSLEELSPSRKWNLIQVDVTAEELDSMRSLHVSQLIYPLCTVLDDSIGSLHVSQLIYPLCTVLDDSIGCALWFGARGRGTLFGQENKSLYSSQARTLLIGIGADEQLGGYSRHRSKFMSDGWRGLLEELDMDIKRLAQRNLGRDDRCVADHHRDGQFPFLDEKVVTFLQQLPVWKKVDLTLPRGVGEKRLLREVAVLLGCHGAAQLPKRAIQFGSRIAKLSGASGGRKCGGSDKCNRLIIS